MLTKQEYLLGHSDRELERLRIQARCLARSIRDAAWSVGFGLSGLERTRFVVRLFSPHQDRHC
jgi:hypothetical protein